MTLLLDLVMMIHESNEDKVKFFPRSSKKRVKKKKKEGIKERMSEL